LSLTGSFQLLANGVRRVDDLNKALLNTLTVARNELKYVADVETQLGDLPLVVCSLSDMNQVFVNLLVNAAHAIAEAVEGTGKRGRILIRTRPEGPMALITVSDTGAGIPEGIRDRIFRSLFYDKGSGPRNRPGTRDCEVRGGPP
jgi:signal transduction histidine kinase